MYHKKNNNFGSKLQISKVISFCCFVGAAPVTELVSRLPSDLSQTKSQNFLHPPSSPSKNGPKQNNKRGHRASDVCWSSGHIYLSASCGFTASDRNLGSGPPATSFHKFHWTVYVFRFLPIGTRLKLSSGRVKWGERQLYCRDKTDTIDRGTVCKCDHKKNWCVCLWVLSSGCGEVEGVH